MNRLRHPAFVVVALVVFLALAAWLAWGGKQASKPERTGTSSAKVQNKSTDAPRKDNDPKPRLDDAAATMGQADGDNGNRDDADDFRLPEPGTQDWDPAAFRNNRFHFRLPVAEASAQHPSPIEEFLGTPAFVYSSRPLDFLYAQDYGHNGLFDPARANGMLVVDLGVHDPRNASIWLAESNAAAVSPDGGYVYSLPMQDSLNRFAIPYSYDRGDMIGLKVAGKHMLPVEAVISQYGGFGGNRNLRKSILMHGFASVDIRTFPADCNNFRTIVVLDVEGRAVADGMLIHDGVQIFGRSDVSGHLRLPWPVSSAREQTRGWFREKFFFLSAPGYVPVLIERAELENASGPVQITMRAHELLVSVRQTVPDPQVLKLGIIAKAESEILKNGADLIPIPNDYSLENWEDVDIILRHRGDPERVERMRAVGRPPDFAALEPVLYGSTAGIFDPAHQFGGFGARKLAEALGRNTTENWPQYAHWYCGRWDYDERDGRFDVALPYAGRFLLLVGEYNRGIYRDQRNGKITHALYIDATDPANLQSKLITHPLG